MSVMTKEKLATAMTQRFLSNVWDVIGNFKKSFKSQGGVKKNSISALRCDSGGHHSTRAE